MANKELHCAGGEIAEINPELCRVCKNKNCIHIIDGIISDEVDINKGIEME